MLRKAPDLIGRLRSLAAQGKAVVYSHAKVTGRASSAPDPVDPALLDAITDIEENLGAWGRLFNLYNLEGLDAVLADVDQIEPLWAAVLDLHEEREYGSRDFWSLADAAAKWGVERRDRFVYPTVIDDDGEVVVTPVAEWHDPLLPSSEAAKRAGVQERQLRKWVEKDVIAPVAKLRDNRGVVTKWFRASEIDRAAAIMRDRRHAGVALTSE